MHRTLSKVSRNWNFFEAALGSCKQPNSLNKVFSASIIQKNFYSTNCFDDLDTFPRRHIGPSEEEIKDMLNVVGCATLDEFTDKIIPQNIKFGRDLKMDAPLGEKKVLQELKKIASKNKLNKSFIGMGYYDTIVPAVIQRNILENPGWYTPYTPYQAEVAQGRLESLLNFQTMVQDLTGLPVANASLLDEATAGAEAMFVCYSNNKRKGAFFVDENTHPQTIDVIKTRAAPYNLEVVVGKYDEVDFQSKVYCGAVIQYPNTYGKINNYEEFIKKAHEGGALVVCATDLMACINLKPPGEIGADIAIGNSQRFGVPLGYGGPHAAFLATQDKHKRSLPGRIIGVSKDKNGNLAYRMALQTREQHIRRDKATSNICTAQALLANMAAMYAVYHGPTGLKDISNAIHSKTVVLKKGLENLGFEISKGDFFDTIQVTNLKGNSETIHNNGLKHNINFRKIDKDNIGISLDETTTPEDVEKIWKSFSGKDNVENATNLAVNINNNEKFISEKNTRKSEILTHPIFNVHDSEHEMLRYMATLERKDIGLNYSMIPLGSCTMKLNATTEMIPVTWPEFGNIHPFVPVDQAQGYKELFEGLNADLKEITGFDDISLQPNAGSQGEYSGLMTIKKYLESKGEAHRNICIIPLSAHGTNPASAVMAGMKVVTVPSTKEGNVDVEKLKETAEKHKDNLAAFMITYPSTHGVFETSIKEICQIIHDFGGQVYMDGANMNAQCGLCRPGDIGADVCHLNLHKTFCIPHGGGGPGMGPIGVKSHLAPFLPGHSIIKTGGEKAMGAIAGAPFSSSSILPISYVYLKMMGANGIKKSTQVAILSANYMARKLEGHFDVLYKAENGLSAHEFIIDMRKFNHVAAEDVAKRLMDYGFHAPTMSFPVANTLMLEPTESEPTVELDRFIEALIRIRKEIDLVESGNIDPKNNMLCNAPHTMFDVTESKWDRPYDRQVGAFPAPWVRASKIWPTVGRIDNAYGDRNLIYIIGIPRSGDLTQLQISYIQCRQIQS